MKQKKKTKKKQLSWLHLPQSHFLPNSTTLIAHFLRNQKPNLICLVKAKYGIYAVCVCVCVRVCFHAVPEPQRKKKEQ